MVQGHIVYFEVLRIHPPSSRRLDYQHSIQNILRRREGPLMMALMREVRRTQGVNSRVLSRIQWSQHTLAFPKQISFIRLPYKGSFFFDTWTSLSFLSFVSSERIKSFALFPLNLTLGRNLLHTPYVHSSALELK
jgi:hypothetical protein